MSGWTVLNVPTLDDYYEPYTYDYQSIFNAPTIETHGRQG